MKKDELVTKLSEQAEVSKTDVNKVLAALSDVVAEALKADDKVALPDLGSFQVKERAARTGRNPRTGETIEIAAAKVPSFKVAKALKDSLK